MNVEGRTIAPTTTGSTCLGGMTCPQLLDVCWQAHIKHVMLDQSMKAYLDVTLCDINIIFPGLSPLQMGGGGRFGQGQKGIQAA